MKVLDLFSGIGGFSLGLERAGMETIAFCEYDKHAQKVLKKHWPDIPIHDDVRLLDGKQYRGSVDVVCGGFPCQDLSAAGKQSGFEGERSSLYKEMLRIISECRPGYAIFENVTGLLTGESGRWFAKFLYDLAEIGYNAEWHCMEAAYIGATHRRDRVWIVAYRSEDDDKSHIGESIKRQISKSRESDSSTKISTNTNTKRREGFAKISHYIQPQVQLVRSCKDYRGRFSLTEPALRRTDDGVSPRLDRNRIAQLGNSVVPQIPEIIGKAIMDYELK